MKKKYKVLIWIAASFLVIFLAAGIFLVQLKNQIEVSLPEIKDIAENPPVSSQIFDRHGDFIASVELDEFRIAIPLSAIPMHVRYAVVASEDERFYKHKGYDLIGIIRAARNNLFNKDRVEGGSTISQQLARGLFLSPERTYDRKIREILLAVNLEQKYTKDEILEYYLNYVYFGPSPAGRSYGVEAAARNFFGKTSADLSISEAALITGTLDAPSLHSPWVDREASLRRRNLVLSKMLRNKFITEAEHDEALEEALNFKTLESATLYESKYYFVDYIKFIILDLFPEEALLKQGLKIYTTLDMTLQDLAFNALTETFEKAEKDKFFKTDYVDHFGVVQPQGQILVMSPKTGEILAMIGGRDFSKTQFNRSAAKRQPGSLFKIFDYTAAIDLGVVGTGSVIESEPMSMPDHENVWIPEEWIGENQYFGKMDVRDALVRSSNICAIKVAQRTGWERVAYYAEKMGIKRSVLPVPSMAIGSLEVSPLEMATAFGVLANDGIRVDPRAINRITTKDDKLLYEFIEEPIRVIKQDTAILMNDLFRSVFIGVNGTVGFEAGGKTGTSEDFLSGWFVGYTPEIVACAWVGRDSHDVNLPHAKLWGSSFAAPMIKNFFIKIAPTLEKLPFLKQLESVDSVLLCKESGLLATDDCPPDQRIHSTYLKGFAPNRYCTVHGKEFVFVWICPESGELATEFCPNAEEKGFLGGTEPKEHCTLHGKPLSMIISQGPYAVGMPIIIEFIIRHPEANKVELYIDNQRVAVLTNGYQQYEWIPQESGKRKIMVVLRHDDEYITMIDTYVDISQ